MINPSDSHTCKQLIERIFERELKKPIVYHPILLREFCVAERELIFGSSSNLNDYTEKIHAVHEWVIRDSITSVKSILKACKMLLPRKINGLYDARYQIEISTDLIPGELLIEAHDPYRVLSKEELIALYSH